MAKKLDPARKQLKARAKEIAQQTALDDPFGGLGDWDPSGAPRMAIARMIAKFEGMRIAKPKAAAAKPKPVKRAPKPKAQPKPRKGKKVGKLNEVLLKSPGGRTQSIPLVPELRELLLDGWVIVGDESVIQDAYSFLNYIPEEMQSA